MKTGGCLTCNQLDLQTLGSHPFRPKNLSLNFVHGINFKISKYPGLVYHKPMRGSSVNVGWTRGTLVCNTYCLIKILIKIYLVSDSNCNTIDLKSQTVGLTFSV